VGEILQAHFFLFLSAQNASQSPVESEGQAFRLEEIP
jgi:hypothetical protein